MIRVESVCKDFWLAERPADLLRAAFGRSLRTFRALDDVSFEVAAGEVIGIIGPNGSGKSTLLRILTGVSEPTHGRVKVGGKTSAILEVSTGFSPALSGRQNIRRRLILQGVAAIEVARLEAEIIEFSELEDVIDQAVRTYSSGMAARLIFATVTSSLADVLLIDELIVVGDESFQGKCFRRIKELCKSRRTVVLASHSIQFVERLCDRAIWLEKGRIKMIGPAHDVGVAYLGSSADEMIANYPREYGRILNAEVDVDAEVLRLRVTIERHKPTDDLQLQVAVHDNDLGILVGLYNTSWDGQAIPSGIGQVTVCLRAQLPVGLTTGLAGVALELGSRDSRPKRTEDACGWDDGRPVYFLRGSDDSDGGYTRKKLNWERVS